MEPDNYTPLTSKEKEKAWFSEQKPASVWMLLAAFIIGCLIVVGGIISFFVNHISKN
jgi:hypothetical protein